MAIRVGLIGAGGMGAEHARVLAQDVGGAELVAVVDADIARARDVVSSLGVGRAETDALAVIADAEVDAILIASPDATHFDLVMECINRGKPVLCEKPLAVTSEECRTLVDAEIGGGKRIIQVGFMRRFDPGYRAMRSAVVDSAFGAPLMMHCRHRVATALHYLTSDTIPLSSAVHEIDAARFVLGDDFSNVMVRTARPSSVAPNRNPLLFIMETAGGVLIDIEVFVDADYAYDVRAELLFETGTVSLTPPRDLIVRSGRSEGQALGTDWVARFKEAYRAQAIAWLRSISDGTPRGASAWDGYIATKVAEESILALKARGEKTLDVEARPSFYG